MSTYFDSDEESFDAFAEIFAPKTDSTGEYNAKKWGSKLFMCQVMIKDEHLDNPVLEIQLWDPYRHRLIARVNYDGIKDVKTVPDSIRHFVVTVRNGKYFAELGMAFIDATDAMEFSLVLETFSGSKLQKPDAKKRTPKTKTRVGHVSGPDHTETSHTEIHFPHPVQSTHSNVETTDSDSDEFGEFQ